MELPEGNLPFLGPQDIFALAQRQQDLQVMSGHDAKLRIAAFIRGQNPEDLATLISMLTMIAHSADAGASAYYYLGSAHEAMQTTHKRCVCGKDHDAEDLAIEEARLKAERESVEETRIREQYDKYHMEADPNNEGGVRCKKCTLRYSSLADRMLRSPDDCHGCKERAAWG